MSETRDSFLIYELTITQSFKIQSFFKLLIKEFFLHYRPIIIKPEKSTLNESEPLDID